MKRVYYLGVFILGSTLALEDTSAPMFAGSSLSIQGDSYSWTSATEDSTWHYDTYADAGSQAVTVKGLLGAGWAMVSGPGTAATISGHILVSAQTTVTAEMVKPIIEAADKPFTEFAATIRSAQLPGLPLPASTHADQHLVSLSQLLWRQLSNVDVVSSATNKASVLSSLKAMCGVRSWLLDSRSYANLLFAAHIEETVCFSSLSSLVDNQINIDEARSLLRHLGRTIQVGEILDVIEAAAPNSKTVSQFKNSHKI